MRRCLCVAVLAGAAALAGCDGAKPKPTDINVIQIDPLLQFRNVLDNYAAGKPIASEASSMDDLIKRIKAKDAAKGDIAEKGWGELQAAKAGQLAPKAKELLAKMK